MDKRIVYQNESGGIMVVIPAPNCGLTLEEIAQKDVPAGVPYVFVDVSEFPEDRTFRDAWEIEIAEPDGYGIGQEAWFAMKEEAK